jgi:hypothetical protein
MGHASSRVVRLGAALLLTLGLLLSSAACGMNVQTLNPYTPAEGVNFDLGSIHLRNVMVLSRTDGEGYLSASLVSDAPDALLSVTGTVMKADGSDGTPLTVTLPDPVALGNNNMVVLTDRPLITVKSADLQAGLVAKLVFQFSKAGQVTTNAPIVDANQPAYATVTPSTSPSPSS